MLQRIGRQSLRPRRREAHCRKSRIFGSGLCSDQLNRQNRVFVSNPINSPSNHNPLSPVPEPITSASLAAFTKKWLAPVQEKWRNSLKLFLVDLKFGRLDIYFVGASSPSPSTLTNFHRRQLSPVPKKCSLGRMAEETTAPKTWSLVSRMIKRTGERSSSNSAIFLKTHEPRF